MKERMKKNEKEWGRKEKWKTQTQNSNSRERENLDGGCKKGKGKKSKGFKLRKFNTLKIRKFCDSWCDFSRYHESTTAGKKRGNFSFYA
jgi:hypothetical protein